MKKYLLLLTLFFYLNTSAQTILNTKISIAKQHKELAPLLAEIENTYPVRFYYVDSWIREISVTDSTAKGEITIGELLRHALLGSDISYVIPNEHSIVFVKDPTLEFRHLKYLSLAKNSQTEIEKVVIGKRTSYIAGNARITGRVLDLKGNSALAGAQIFVSNLNIGTTANALGDFELQLPKGKHIIKCSYVNFDSKFFDVEIFEDGVVNWKLEESPKLLNEVLVSDRTSREISTSPVGVTQLSIKQIKRIPALLGEVDVIKSIQTLPGVTTAGEAASGFNVRGGGVDQNLILYDGLPVFNSSHVFGFFSSFNAEAIRDVTFIRGSIPAEFGGRISSVLDIISKEGNYKKWSFGGGIGLISSNFFVSGPLKKEKTSISASFRTTYSNWLLNTIKSNYVDLNNSKVNFYDGSIKLTHILNLRSKLTVSSYISHDQFRLQGDSTFQWDTKMLSVKLDHDFTDLFSSAFTIGVGSYSYDVFNSSPTTGFNLRYSILYPSIKAELYYNTSKQKATFGFHSTYYKFSPGTLEPSSGNSNIKYLNIDDLNSVESAFFLSDKFSIFNKIHFDIGMRYSIFQTYGSADINIYKKGEPREFFNVTDTVSYKDGELIKSYSNLEPRIAIRYELSPQSSLKMGYNRMAQYLHLITNTTAITPVDIWQPSNYYFKPQIADQYSLGYFRSFNNNKIETFLEIYYKNIENVLDFKDGAELILNKQIEVDLLQGKSRAYGAEMQVTKSLNRLEGSIGYTYSRSLRTVAGSTESESINNGREYNSNYDQPHVVNINWKYNLTKRHFFTGSFTYRTGRPITLPVSAFSIENFTVSSFSDRNKYRIPDYHRLDIGLVIEGNHKRKKILDGTWVFSIYNVYARKNPYSVFFKEVRPGILRAYRLAIVGTALPSISYNVKF